MKNEGNGRFCPQKISLKGSMKFNTFYDFSIINKQ